MSGPADRLLRLMYEWMEEAEECSSNLRGLANELESLREKCNGWETSGNSLAVAGSVLSICAAAITGGGSLFLAGAVAGITGAGVTVVTKITEQFKSSSKLKQVEEIDKRCNKIAGEMRDLFKELRRECPSSSADEKDKHAVTEFLKAMSRRSNLETRSGQSLGDIIRVIMDSALVKNMATTGLAFVLVFEVMSVLSVFSLELGGTLLSAAISTGGKQFGKAIAITGASKLEGTLFSAAVSTGAKQVGKSAAIKGVSRFLGGVVGLAFSLPEAIDSWTELIKDKHETKASSSVRDAAKTIDNTVHDLSNKLKQTEKILREALESHWPTLPTQLPVCPPMPNVSTLAKHNDPVLCNRHGPLLVAPQKYSRNPFPIGQQNPLESHRPTLPTQLPVCPPTPTVSTFAKHNDPVLLSGHGPLPLGQQNPITSMNAPFLLGELIQRISIGLFTELSIYISNQPSHTNSNQPSSSNSGNKSSYEEYFDNCQPNFHQGSQRGHSAAPGAPAPPDPPRDDDGDSSSERSDSESSSESESSDEIEEEKQEMALLNSRSVYKFFRKNKLKKFRPDTIRQLIEENQLSLLLITETWLPPDSQSHDGFRRILPSNYNLISVPRGGDYRTSTTTSHSEPCEDDHRTSATTPPPQGGGGVAIVHSNELSVEQVHFRTRFTLEYVAATLRIPQSSETVLILTIYRRPQHTNFLDQFRDLLSEVFSSHRSVILAGDFNVRVNDLSRRDTLEFQRTLEDFGLSQLVSDPTRGRNILDLVIAHPDLGLSSPSVQPNSFSDHHTVFFYIPARRLYKKYKMKDKKSKKRIRH